MKKLYTMITILLLSTHVFAADPVVVVPPSPIIPTMTTVTPNEVTSAAEPLTNMVFINESGSTPNINITQTGTNNNLGVSALTPFMFTGDNQIFTSIQTGVNNSLTGGIYGGAVGIVTIEDIGEEIVGSIDNEYDSGEKLYKKLASGRYLINGRIDMDTLNQLLAVKFPEGNYETLGGFLMHRLGKIPQRRERLDYRGITFIIENADQKSIKEVMVISPAQ